MSDSNNKSSDAKFSPQIYRGFNATASPEGKLACSGNDFRPYGAMSHTNDADVPIREEDCSPICVQRVFNNLCGDVDLVDDPVERNDIGPTKTQHPIRISPIDPNKLATAVLEAFNVWEKATVEPPDDHTDRKKNCLILKP